MITGTNTRMVIWLRGDDIWLLAARYFDLSRYNTISDFVDDIRTLNPLILNWRRIASGSSIAIPVIGSSG